MVLLPVANWSEACSDSSREGAEHRAFYATGPPQN
jgi:hypothetical protein